MVEEKCFNMDYSVRAIFLIFFKYKYCLIL